VATSTDIPPQAFGLDDPRVLKVGSGVRVFPGGSDVWLALNPMTARLLKLLARQSGTSMDSLVSEAVTEMLSKRMSARDPKVLEALAAQLTPWDSNSPDYEQVIAEMTEFELAMDGVDPVEGVPRHKDL
jgi:hypothetical protein